MTTANDDAEASTSVYVERQEVPIFKRKSSRRKHAGKGVLSFSSGLEAKESSELETNDARDGSEDKRNQDDDEQQYSLDDLLLLRNMKHKSSAGIDLDRLNRGDDAKRKKSKKDKDASKPKSKEQLAEERWAEQMQRGGLMKRDQNVSVSSEPGARGSKGHHDGADEGEEEHEGGDQGGTHKAGSGLLKKNNFQGETGTVDVDKHMMAYIEEEMNKRRLGQASDDAALMVAMESHDASTSANMPHANAEDELYRIAEKYRQIQQSAKDAIASAKLGGNKTTDGKKNAEKEKEEGNVTLSTAMLTSVPEIDLGMEVRMRNIEATERARKAMEEDRRARRQAQLGRSNDNEDENERNDLIASARFFRHPNRVQSDIDAHRQQATTQDAQGHHRAQPTSAFGQSYPSANGAPKRTQMATDDVALERFKKRQRNQLKR